MFQLLFIFYIFHSSYQYANADRVLNDPDAFHASPLNYPVVVDVLLPRKSISVDLNTDTDSGDDPTLGKRNIEDDPTSDRRNIGDDPNPDTDGNATTEPDSDQTSGTSRDKNPTSGRSSDNRPTSGTSSDNSPILDTNGYDDSSPVTIIDGQIPDTTSSNGSVSDTNDTSSGQLRRDYSNGGHWGDFAGALSSFGNLFSPHNHGGSNRPGGGLQLNVPSMTCRIKRFRGIHYEGPLTGVSRGVDNGDICTAACWQFRKQGRRCDSVNYMSSAKKCELRQGVLHQTSESYTSQYDSEYIVPTQCDLLGSGTSGWSNTGSSAGSWTGTGSHFGNSAGSLAGAGSSFGSSVGSLTGSGALQGTGGLCGQTYYQPNIKLFRKNNRRFKRQRQRIVGGSEAVAHSYPWIVSLQQGRSHYCGGTLIRVSDLVEESDIVITAAHCLADKPFDLHAVLGAHELDGSGIVKIRAETYRPHKYYDAKRTINDIGIVKLEKPVRFDNTIQPICLPVQGEAIGAGEMGVVAGWGTLQEGRIKLPGRLMQVAVPVVDDYNCVRYYPRDVTLKYMFCAGFERGGKDSCQGDSGGPLVFRSGTRWTLRGIVSFGEGCARARKPGVYTRVSYYREWIDENIRELTSVRM